MNKEVIFNIFLFTNINICDIMVVLKGEGYDKRNN